MQDFALFYEYKQKDNGDEVPTQQHVQGYLLERREAGESWSTINVDYSSLRKYFKVLKDYKWSLKKLPKESNFLHEKVSKIHQTTYL